MEHKATAGIELETARAGLDAPSRFPEPKSDDDVRYPTIAVTPHSGDDRKGGRPVA